MKTYMMVVLINPNREIYMTPTKTFIKDCHMYTLVYIYITQME